MMKRPTGMNREVYALLYSDKNDAYVPMFPLSLESLPHSVLQCRSLVDTESNWHCRTEWGWLARQLPTVAGVCCHGSFLYAFLLHPHSVSFSLHTHTHTAIAPPSFQRIQAVATASLKPGWVGNMSALGNGCPSPTLHARYM